MKFPLVLAICLLVSVGYVSADWGSWWGSVTNGTGQLLNKTKSELNKFGETIVESANDLADKTKKGFEEAKNEVENFLDKTKEELEKVGETIRDKAQDWTGKTKEGLEMAQNEITNVLDKATVETKQLTDKALNKGQDLYEKSVNKTQQFVNDAQETYSKVVNETKEFTEDALQKTNKFLLDNYKKFLEQHEKNMKMAKELAAKVSAKVNELKKEFDVKYEEAKHEMEDISIKLKDMAAQSSDEFDKLSKQIQHIKNVVVEQYQNYQARAEVILVKVVEQIQASREKVYTTLIEQAKKQFGKENVNEQECKQVINDVFMATLQSAKNETVPCFKSLLEKGINSFVNTTKFLVSTSKVAYDRYIKKCELNENSVEPVKCERHEAKDLVENGNSLLSSVKDLGLTIFSTKFELFKCIVLNMGRSVANFTKEEIMTKKMCIKNDALMSENGANKFESMINMVMDTVITYQKYLNDMKKYLEVKLVEGIEKVANVDGH